MAKDDWAYYSLNFNDQTLNKSLSFSDEQVDLVIQVQQTGSKFGDPNLYINFDKILPTLA